MSDRYDISGNPEGQYQPGSNEQVLINKLGITDTEIMEITELDLLIKLEMELFSELSMDQRITVNDIGNWHRRWLHKVYEWAGNYRTVTLSRSGFPFAAVPQLPKLMEDYDHGFLREYTPCIDMAEEELVNAMARCHVEFIIIHPFRDGNGRLGRLLTTVMALQAGMPPLDFKEIEDDKVRYIKAIHAGHAEDYGPMELIFSEILKYSLLQTSRNESND